MKVVSVSIVCKDEDAQWLSNELNRLQYGVYSLGTDIQEASEDVIKEVKMMIPVDVLCGYLETDINDYMDGLEKQY